jgi:hypothetical protein
VNRKDFQQLANLRIAEARVLLDNNMYAGAYYLAGYAVECALKACIAKRTRRHDFPPEPKQVSSMYVHDLTALLNPAGLKAVHDAEVHSNRNFAVNWSEVIKWSEAKRYDHTIGAVEANVIYRAIIARGNGVLPWLKRFW